MIVDPNTKESIMSNDTLLKEFKNPKKYKRVHLYALMARRANNSNVIKKCLFDLILDKEKRKEYFLGIIIHAWLPVLHILEEGSCDLQEELKQTLIEWDLKERTSFIKYIKKNEKYYEYLKSIL